MVSDLTISIINHSNPDLLIDCLQSIYATTHKISFDIWIVDNATDQRMISEIKSEFPKILWIFNEKRLGFSANHNQVLAQAEGRHVCILNDDTIIHDGALDELVDYLDQHSDVGMVGSRLLNPDGSRQNCTFKFMTLWSEFIGIMQLPRFLCGLKKIGIDNAQNGDVATVVDWVLGACIVVRSNALKQIGLLDSVLSPIANTEEVDWCYRAKKLGWKVVFDPKAQITHIGGQSMNWAKTGVNWMRVEMYRTRLAFFRKHYSLFAYLALRLAYIILLPWNILMMLQGKIKGTISDREYKSFIETNQAIVLLALKRI
jgi:GT2 family glycosyltransferase